MSGFFCNSPRLQLLERQMRQPPGYRPRGQGWMFDMEEWKSRGNYSEIVDCVISRMQMEHLKKRIQEVFGNAEKELIFYDSRHRNDFSSLLLGRRKKNLCGLPNYAAAVFLLSADENLWEKVSPVLTNNTLITTSPRACESSKTGCILVIHPVFLYLYKY